MKRNIDINEVSDGKLYGLNDMVKAGCDGCDGCSACCQGMGKSIVLDPFDVYRLVKNLNVSFEQLLAGPLELSVVDGIILPNLKMQSNDEKCYFLNSEGRCNIHSFRPGICRLFPIGRLYENRSFKYFLQVHECPKPNKSKVKVKNWLDTENIRAYENYINKWHYMLEDLQEKMSKTTDEQLIKSISMHVLNKFYIQKVNEETDVYEHLNAKIKETYETFDMKFVGEV